MKDILAEVEEQPFKHQNWTSAAEDGERLARQQTENPTGNRCAQKTLQNTLHTQTGTALMERFGWKNGKRSEKKKTQPDLIVFCGVAQQTSEGDGVCHSSQVNKQNGGQRLNVYCIGEVTEKERRFSFDVENEAATEPERRNTNGVFISQMVEH